MRQIRAFTLIELLVVLVILGALAGLIGPMTLGQIEKIQAQQEWSELRNQIDFQRRHAYLQGRRVHLQFDGKQLVLQVGGEPPSQISFDWLFFKPQQLTVDLHGGIAPQYLEVYLRRQQINYKFENAHRVIEN